MSQNQSPSAQESNHQQLLSQWKQRMDQFAEVTRDLAVYLKGRARIIDLNKEECSVADFGFERQTSEEDSQTPAECHDSTSHGNTTYCKLIYYNLIHRSGSTSQRRSTVIGREYKFDVAHSADRLKKTIIEGVRIQSFFSKRAKDLTLLLYGLFAHNDGQVAQMLVFQECFPASSLAHKLQNQQVDIASASNWTRQLSQAAEHLNLAGVAHRFIRPENVLLTISNQVKLAGFDMACIFWDGLAQDEPGRKQPIGLPEQVPRQLLDHLPPECHTKQYNASQVDSWSVGVILCQLLTASHPFDITKPDLMLQQWKLSPERRYRVPFINEQDSYRTLLDDIFQPLDRRMTTFDLARDPRLSDPDDIPKDLFPFYRIDLNMDHPPAAPSSTSTATPTKSNFDASMFNKSCLEMFKLHGTIKKLQSEDEIQTQEEGHTSYVLMRSQSFEAEFSIFHNDHFLRAVSSNGKNKYLAKIFLLNSMSKPERATLIGENWKILSYFGTTNCIETLHRVADIFRIKSSKLYIFYQDELVGGKSLWQLTNNKSFSNKKSILHGFMQQLAVTVQQLTSYGVAHRYIRPEYIFIVPSGKIKVTHLEMACFGWNPEIQQQLFRSKGLPDGQEDRWNHLPPEAFQGRYDCFQVDVWSFGVVLVYCLTRQYPFTVPHSMEEATQAWDNFKNRVANRALLEKYLKLLDRIFLPVDERIRIYRIVQAFEGASRSIFSGKPSSGGQGGSGSSGFGGGGSRTYSSSQTGRISSRKSTITSPSSHN